MFSSTVWAFAGGLGTQEDPWQIATAEQLDAVRHNLDGHFILIADIDLDVAPYNTGEGWEPIGTNAARFTGHFNGGEFVVSNLFIDRPGTNDVGLFGYMGAGAAISDLQINGAFVRGGSYTTGSLVGHGFQASISNVGAANVDVAGPGLVGGLVGFNDWQSTLSDSYATGVVVSSGNSPIGGLTGENYGTIYRCFAEVNVDVEGVNPRYAGGLVGLAYGDIIDSYAAGDVRGKEYVGGLVGDLGTFGAAEILRSYATGNVAGDGVYGDYIGGLVGRMASGSITQSFAIGEVRGYSYHVGGLVGYLENGSLTDVYATGDVTAVYDYVGGLVGEGKNATITNAYAVGVVSGDSSLGGLVGIQSLGLNVHNSYYKEAMTGLYDSFIGVSKTTSELQQLATFSGWDFAAVWSINEGAGYPFLAWQPVLTPFAGGQGTLQDPYQIATAEQLAAMSDYLDSHFVLVNNIDLSVFGQWEPIGIYVSWENPANTPFTGSLDGAGFTISDLFINQPDLQDAGLFGLTDGASIENINLADVNITGRTAGGLIGWAYATTVKSVVTSGEITALTRAGGLLGQVFEGTLISDSSSSCTVSTTNGTNAGGLIGQMDGTTINRSYATGDVSTGTQDLAGGLVGEARYNSKILSSFATGDVTGASETGGLVGYLAQDSHIENSYATGLVDGGNNRRVGGLVGYIYSNATIVRSFARGVVFGGNEVGGLVGSIVDVTSSIVDSFATGQVTASENVGGLVGRNGGLVERAYAVGRVSTLNGVATMGGLIGSNEGSVNDSYWDIETSGLSISAGGEGRTTADLQENEQFAGWDFTDTWLIVEGVTYPFLSWQAFSSTTPTLLSPVNGAIVTDLFQTLAWLPVNVPEGKTLVGYEVELSTDPEFGVGTQIWRVNIAGEVLAGGFGLAVLILSGLPFVVNSRRRQMLMMVVATILATVLMSGCGSSSSSSSSKESFVVVTEDSKAVVFTLSDELSSDDTYYWRVRAIYEDDESSEWSEAWSFGYPQLPI